MTVSTVLLGYKIETGGQKRWLYNTEIAYGVIKAISSSNDIQVGIVDNKS